MCIPFIYFLYFALLSYLHSLNNQSNTGTCFHLLTVGLIFKERWTFYDNFIYLYKNKFDLLRHFRYFSLQQSAFLSHIQRWNSTALATVMEQYWKGKPGIYKYFSLHWKFRCWRIYFLISHKELIQIFF